MLPGDRLGVIEEFTADSGTYIKEGIICSTIVGRALPDLLNKRVSVYPLVHGAKLPRTGSVVLGEVSSVRKQNAFVRIYKISDEVLSGFFSGLLHVSDVQMRYVESMFNVCKPGDTIRGKVISGKNGVYHLSLKGSNLGVVYAFCSRCGHMLEPKQHWMHCPECGKSEKRKKAIDYGVGMTA